MDRVIGGAPQPSEAPRARVLVVDDDPSLIRFLEMYLEGHGFRVSSALSGEEGIERARELQPDVLVLDGGLSDVEAGEFLRRLRGEERTWSIPVMVLAARSGDDRFKGLGSQADDYLTKPFDIQELKARIVSILTRRREQVETTQVEKLKTLREVIASVSHEVNNPLAAILMSAEALALRHGHLADVREKSRLIQEHVLRIRDILKRLEGVRVVASKPYVAGERILDLGREEGKP